MSDTPKDFVEDMLNDIVAFKIDVKKITAKSKLSQNKLPTDFDNVTIIIKKQVSIKPLMGLKS